MDKKSRMITDLLCRRLTWSIAVGAAMLDIGTARESPNRAGMDTIEAKIKIETPIGEGQNASLPWGTRRMVFVGGWISRVISGPAEITILCTSFDLAILQTWTHPKGPVRKQSG
jgi:hypothetical protein